ncbi:hypothetical protein [uncultured Roseibium sp.]|uniref:hypothetical protein n=1 Tax=uncultured Roseibium sp. TaxID=1936171 RepID=UPI0025980F57|nr:hypothetical protein [uncultured Roseibium sp.]
MRGIAFWFYFTGVIYVIAGMAFGIHLSATHDYTLAPVHAHLNLIGWVTMGLFGLYYHAVPTAADGLLAKIHFGVATVGLWLITPGIAFAIQEKGETLAKLGSIVSLASAVIFLIVVFRSRQRAAA